MFLGHNRFEGAQHAPVTEGVVEGAGFLNQADHLPSGIQRFLAKKGINSSVELFNRVYQTLPRMLFRK